MKFTIIFTGVLLVLISFHCRKAIVMPEKGKAILAGSSKASRDNKEGLEEVKQYSITYPTREIILKGSAETKIFRSAEKTREAFTKDIPQRPFSDISLARARIVRTRNAVWMMKNNAFTYYFFYIPNDSWEGYPDLKKKHFTAAIIEFAESLTAMEK